MNYCAYLLGTELRAEDVGVSLAERRVVVGRKVGGARESLVVGAVRSPASDDLTVGDRELRVDVDRGKGTSA